MDELVDVSLTVFSKLTQRNLTKNGRALIFKL